MGNSMTLVQGGCQIVVYLFSQKKLYMRNKKEATSKRLNIILLKESHDALLDIQAYYTQGIRPNQEETVNKLLVEYRDFLKEECKFFSV